MVKLFLHCGYHKTGSSFLQVMFAQNREYLLKNKIYFPDSDENKKMISGKISPGNGFELVKAIRSKNHSLIYELLKGWMDESIENNANILLISSEGLFHVLAELGLIKLFNEVCTELKINDIRGLLFFRDPVSHIFSVFKHRGKNGEITDYKEWVKNDYETLNLTKNFLTFYKEFNIKWAFRKYSSESKHMAKIGFDDFLQIKPPEIPKKERVNISLTLSEIVTIRELKKYVSKKYIREIHTILSNLPIENKANDVTLQKYYTEIAYQEIERHKNVIIEVNSLLPPDNLLELKELETNDRIDKEIVSLSPDQIKIFFGFIKEFNNFQSKIIFNFKNLLKRIRRKIKLR